jgi:hypothetical protein
MKTEVDEIESNIKDDLKEIKLSKEEKEHIIYRHYLIKTF